jgi:hypothetical protein
MRQAIMFIVSLGFGLGVVVQAKRTLNRPVGHITVTCAGRQAPGARLIYAPSTRGFATSKGCRRPIGYYEARTGGQTSPVSSRRQSNITKIKVWIAVALIAISSEAGIIVALFVAIGGGISATSLVLDGLGTTIAVFSLGISSVAFFLD